MVNICALFVAGAIRALRDRLRSNLISVVLKAFEAQLQFTIQLQRKQLWCFTKCFCPSSLSSRNLFADLLANQVSLVRFPSKLNLLILRAFSVRLTLQMTLTLMMTKHFCWFACKWSSTCPTSLKIGWVAPQSTPNSFNFAAPNWMSWQTKPFEWGWHHRQPQP